MPVSQTWGTRSSGESHLTEGIAVKSDYTCIESLANPVWNKKKILLIEDMKIDFFFKKKFGFIYGIRFQKSTFIFA